MPQTIKGQTATLIWGIGRMEIEKLKQSYKNQLLKAGVDAHRAEQAIKNMTREELQLIREIWSEWTVVLPQTENEVRTST